MRLTRRSVIQALAGSAAALTATPLMVAADPSARMVAFIPKSGPNAGTVVMRPLAQAMDLARNSQGYVVDLSSWKQIKVDADTKPSAAVEEAEVEHSQGICSQSYEKGFKAAATDYVDGLQEGRAHAVRMSMPNAIVAGALYDFMGFLTTRPESFTVGSGESVYALMEHFTEWSEQRSLDPDIANVQGWQDALKHLV